MDLEKRIEKYKKSPLFRLNENLRYVVEKNRIFEIPLVLAGILAGSLINKSPEFDSKIMREEHLISLLTWGFLTPSLLLSSGFFGRKSYLKNFSKNKLVPLIGFSLGFGTAYYSDTHSNNLGDLNSLSNSLFVGGISYYFMETLRTFVLSSNQNFFTAFKSLFKKNDSFFISSVKFNEKVKLYKSKEDLLNVISSIFDISDVDNGLIEPVTRLATRICSIDLVGNVLRAYNIKRFHQEKRYSNLFSEMQNLDGIELEEMALLKAYYISTLCKQDNINLPEFLKLGENPTEILWSEVWKQKRSKFAFQTLGGRGVYEVPSSFSKFLQQQLIFKKGNVKREVELLNQAKEVFSRYKELDTVTINYLCDEGMILGRELGMECWNLEDKKLLATYGKGIALLQNNLTENLEGGKVLDLDCHPGNIYVAEKVVFADLRGKDYREDVIDVVKAASQIKGKSEYLIDSWLKQRGHEKTYGREVLMEMMKFPKVCDRKKLRGMQGSLEIAQRRYEKAEWARNQLGLERRIY